MSGTIPATSGNSLLTQGSSLLTGPMTLERKEVPQPVTLSASSSTVVSTKPPNFEAPKSMSVSNRAGAYVTATLDAGLLSVAEDVSNRAMANAHIEAVGKEILSARKRIDDAIEHFHSASNGQNRQLVNYVDSQIALIIAGGNVTETQATNTNFVLNACQQVANRLKETASVLLDLEKLNGEGKLGSVGSIVNLVFETRMKELKLLTEKLKLLQEHETFELQVETTARNQVLKEQTEQFNLWVKSVQLGSEESKKELDNRLAEREQVIKHELDLGKLAIDQMKATSENRREQAKIALQNGLEQQKAEFNREIDKTKIESAERIAQEESKRKYANEKVKIATQTTVELGKVAADLIKPKCSVM